MRFLTDYWDLAIYLNAYQALRLGEDPYSNELLIRELGPYMYAPITLFLWAFHPLVYVVLSPLCVLGLLYVWWKHWDCRWWELLIITCLGLGMAMTIALKGGQAVVYEQLLLWIGLTFYLKKSYNWASLFICLSAMFKLWPIVFLLVMYERKQTLWWALAFVVSIFVQAWWYPSWLLGVASTVSWQSVYKGEWVYSLYMRLTKHAWLFVIIMGVVWALTAKIFNRCAPTYRVRLLMASLVCSLPVVQPYTLIALIPLAAWTTREINRRAVALTLFCVGIYPMTGHPLSINVQLNILYHWPLMMVWAIWGTTVYTLFQRRMACSLTSCSS